MQKFLQALAMLLIFANLISASWLTFGCTFDAHVFCGVISYALVVLSGLAFFGVIKFPTLKALMEE